MFILNFFKRKSNFKILFIIFGIIILIIILAQILAGFKFFKIKKLKIYGNEKISANFIYNLSGLTPEKNIFEINLKAVENKINQYYLIKNVKVEKKFPDTIDIILDERKPIALIECYNKTLLKTYFYEIDEDGYILDKHEKKIDENIDENNFVLKKIFKENEIIFKIDNLKLEEGNRVIDENILNNIKSISKNLKDYFLLENIEYIYLDDNYKNYIKLNDNHKFIFGKDFSKEDLVKINYYKNYVKRYNNFNEIDLRFDDIIVLK